jgi:hypothetical protein
MNIFQDKVFDEMDEITQMIEPFESKINVELAQFPDEFLLEEEFFETFLSYNSRRLGYNGKIYEDLRKIVERKATSLNLNFLAETARLNRDFMEQFFKLEVSEDTIYDAETNKLYGEIKIIKVKIGYEDRDLEAIMENYLSTEFSRVFRSPGAINNGRTNEILELFNVKDGMAERKSMYKIRFLRNKYIDIIKDRSLNIRDIELFKRFVKWNILYIANGSLPALSNITKIKIMMRRGQPIYSINEDIV